MTQHLGGPESPEKIAERQARYASGSRQFKIVDDASGEGVGWVGYWDRTWRGEHVYEIGWAVSPSFKGRGIASLAAAEAIEAARSERGHRYLHAVPSVDNAASNAVCRKLGFALVGECEYEFPPGNPMRGNEWRLDVFADG